MCFAFAFQLVCHRNEGIAVLDEPGARCLGLKRTGKDIPGKEGAAEDEMMDERRA